MTSADGGDVETGLEQRTAHLVDPRVSARGIEEHALDASEPGDPGAGLGDTIAGLPRIPLDDGGASGSLAPSSRGRSDYAIVATLGEGGMGRVHLARQRSLARDVAAKVLKAGAPPTIARALLREARIAGTLEHPGVIPVHAIGVDDEGRPMLVMKRVDGVDLAMRLTGEPQTGDALVACLEILIQVCRPLELAHARGIIHRDIKPENIMMGGFGEVYLLDWGIATSIDGGSSTSIVGTPVYMAPEMVTGRPVDARTDVYLLGATLHEVLTGKPRHAGTRTIEVVRSALRSDPVVYATDVPEALASLCNRCTAKDPEARPRGVAEVREELSAFLRHRTAHALADVARARLEELEVLLGVTEEPPSELAQAYRLITEARFGLAQALDADDRASTRAEMRRCLALGIDLELRQDHVDSAAAILRELTPPDPELEARVEARRARLRDRAREHARLEKLGRDLDPSANAPQRTLPILVMAGAFAAMAWYVAFRAPSITAELLVLAGACGALVVIAVGLAFRRRVLTNAFNRRAGGLLILGMIAELTNRTLGLIAGTPPVQTIAVDLFTFAAIAGTATVTLLRPMWPCALTFLAGAIIARMWPSTVPLVFSITTFVALSITAAVLARARRDAR